MRQNKTGYQLSATGDANLETDSSRRAHHFAFRISHSQFPVPYFLCLLSILLVAPPATARDRTRASRLSLVKGDREPPQGRKRPDKTALARLREAVTKKPKDRTARFNLVQGLMRGGKLREALSEVKKWRRADAYNLVVVRLLGDIYTELKQYRQARRAYSAVVELLPQDAMAQRALAMVLKQSGQLEAAHRRLRVATRLRPKDMRIAFELADVAHRLGRAAEATRRFVTIVESPDTPRQIRYPAKQRLAQIYAAGRLAARRAGNKDEEARLAKKIRALEVKGGARNDIKIYLTWDTDRSDVDLWVTNPAGQKVFYSRKVGKFGGALFDDVTSGYGPESFTAREAARGTYLVQVNFYSTSRRAFSEARGEVVVILNEGTAKEKRHVLPYRLFSPKQTVSVARIRAL